MLPAHQRLEADHLVRGEIDDGLVVHRDLTGLKRVPKLVDERETADCLLVHGGREQDVAALTLALGLVQGGVGVLDELGPVLARTINDLDPDARVLFEVRPSEEERLGEHAEKTLGHLLSLSRGCQSLGQVEELVAPEAAQRVRGASHLFQAARERYE